MIQMPIGWTWNRLNDAVNSVGTAPPSDYWAGRTDRRAVPTVRRIGLSDVRMAVAEGWDDFKSHRTDVMFLCVMYPLVGLVLAQLASGNDLLTLIFPLASGFALVGPVAAIGLNEMSRKREAGLDTSWLDAFGVLRSPSIVSIAILGVVLVALLAVWLFVAGLIYSATMGPEQPASTMAFLHDLFATKGGWALIVVGCGVGLVFAVLALAVSVVSFPLLLDRYVKADVAIATSVRAVLANPVPMAAWAAVVVGGLVLGSIPFLLGLAVILPILGHATWHLYRRVVA